MEEDENFIVLPIDFILSPFTTEVFVEGRLLHVLK